METYSPRHLFTSTPMEHQSPEKNFTIDVNHGTSYIPGTPQYRVANTKVGLLVQAWPSNGTFVCKENPTQADMIYIGLNPLDMVVKRTSSQQEEDAFTDQLRLIGAQVWEDQDTWCNQYYDPSEPPGYQILEQSIFAWPSDGKGLWVYNYNKSRELRPRELLQTLRGVKDMDEQCAILKKWQATFYEHPGDYPPIADLFKDHNIG